jgi:hypothetical protein
MILNLLPGGRVGARGSCNMRREATEVQMARKLSCDEALLPVPTLAAMRASNAEPRESILAELNARNQGKVILKMIDEDWAWFS